MTDVFVTEKFIKQVRDERRQGKIHHELNIRHDKDGDRIIIETCKGRARRPLILVEDGKSLFTEERKRQLEKLWRCRSIRN